MSEFKDFVPLLSIVVPPLSIVVVIVGWLINHYLNRRLEISKKRFDIRINLLNDYLNYYIKAEKEKSLDDLNDMQARFYIYGNQDEIDLIEKMVKQIIASRSISPQPSDDANSWYKTHRELKDLLANRLRDELRLPKIKIR